MILVMKERLNFLAKEFELKFDSSWFRYIWISKKENTILEYMWMCPDPIFEKYGSNCYERAKNIENFLTSSDFEECLNRFGGQVINKNTFKKYFPKSTEYIENKEIREDTLRIYHRIMNAMGKSGSIAILTSSEKSQEKERLKEFVLFHEWIHILINKNNLRFEFPKLDNWRYNEGLVTYFQEFYYKNLDKLEEKIKNTNYDFQKQYYINAIKFRKLLKDAHTPRERKELIIKLKEAQVKN